MSKPRKPLRRTAWSMLIGGVVVAGLMLGGGALVVSQRRLTPDFTGQATITCEHQVMVLSGTKLTVAGILRSAWIVLPLFVAVLGILLFFPRFTMVWASLSQPIGSWIRRRNS